MKCPGFSSRVTKIRPKLATIISSEGMSLARVAGGGRVTTHTDDRPRATCHARGAGGEGGGEGGSRVVGQPRQACLALLSSQTAGKKAHTHVTHPRHFYPILGRSLFLLPQVQNVWLCT